MVGSRGRRRRARPRSRWAAADHRARSPRWWRLPRASPRQGGRRGRSPAGAISSTASRSSPEGDRGAGDRPSSARQLSFQEAGLRTLDEPGDRARRARPWPKCGRRRPRRRTAGEVDLRAVRGRGRSGRRGPPRAQRGPTARRSCPRGAEGAGEAGDGGGVGRMRSGGRARRGRRPRRRGPRARKGVAATRVPDGVSGVELSGGTVSRAPGADLGRRGVRRRSGWFPGRDQRARSREGARETAWSRASEAEVEEQRNGSASEPGEGGERAVPLRLVVAGEGGACAVGRR